MATAEEEKQEEARNPTSIDPIDYQCVLLEQSHALSDHHQKMLATEGYKNIKQLTTNGEPGSVLSRIHHGGRTEQVREIMDLCPDVHALLTPYLKISRILYTPSGDPIPNSEQQLKIPNFLSPEDVDSILKGKLGRAPGAGVKSFKWELAGVQPEDVDNNITATLVVYFQTADDFFKDAASKSNPGGYQAGKDEPTFLDLIVNSPGSRKAKGKKPSAPPVRCSDTAEAAFHKYDGKNFRIKVCAGWSTPPNLATIYPQLRKTVPGGQKSRYEALQQALAATRVSLFLQQVRHDIDFKENGSLTLTIQYQAALSGITREAGTNILVAGKNAAAIEGKKDEKKQKEADAAETDDEADTEELLEEIAALEETDRKEKYEQLLANIYKSDKVYKIMVDQQQLLVPDLSKLPPGERMKLAAERRQKYLDDAGPVSSRELQDSTLLEDLGPDSSASASDSAEAAKKKAAKTRKKAAKGGWFTGPKDQVEINYIYLGDLIDAVLSGLPGGPPSFSFFLSEVEMISPLRAFQISQPNLKKLMTCQDPAGSEFLKSIGEHEAARKAGQGPGLNLSKLYKLMSIGDIPISLDAFQAYFLKSVVDKQRDKYYFLNFVKDICGQLITKALRSGCYGSGFKFSARFDAQPLSFYKNKWAAKLSVEDLAKATTQLTCEEADVTKFGLGMILFSTDSKSRNLQGNFDDDLKRGIYHNYIGASCGLMKKLDFKREDQAYLREAKIQKSGDLGAEQLRELYSVNITMVGNNLYKNGGYTYVSPVLINTPKEQLTLLGLHGYYLVTEVSSELTENSFTTSIRALQEGIEFGGTSPPSSTKPEEEKSPSQPEHDKDAADHYVKEMEAQQSLPVTSTPAAGGDPLHPDDPDHAMREIENQQTIPTFMDQERADDDADFERRDKIYEAGGNPYPSMGTRGVLIHRAFRSSRNSEARAQAQGGTATLEGYDSNTGRQDDPELARQAREANEG